MSSAPDLHATNRLIRKLESIASLSEAERQAIESLPVRIHKLNVRQDIVRDGDKPSHCCLIIDGWACRYKLLSQGKRQILSFHVPGDILDLQSLHVPTMDHSVGTLTKATVAFIPHESLRELTAHHSGIAAIFWRDTLIDAGIFREWLVSMGRRSAFEHVAHLFCELYLKLQAVGLAGNYRCPLPVTQADLADALGLTPVHINRVLQEMRGKTLITLRSSTLVIEAWNELLRVSEFDPTYLHLEKRATG
ncbi:Crp/Fnr family transcriptional regulator [Methylobacterium sp. J-072]|uniref:Crp/Fnr family transcriptional regulator n=1 Tax=Methylobacterium sp. J-072 TaxID=2836651 RepID=UPI001FB90311|nr:Crp/Fnr family transcriptional regulator [Methylobacterium sp. J-072]MCJ2093091.1 Crp/Fnr family transcriptional regulator [Methylobacterium sp. J-072]